MSCEHRLNIPLVGRSHGEMLAATEARAWSFPLANVVSEDPMARRAPR
jgi:hypothetical protein